MSRVVVLLMDSFGLGASKDAPAQDQGANTLAHIADQCAAGHADIDGQRQGRLRLPNLSRYGLAAAAKMSCGKDIIGLDNTNPISALYGYAKEISHGKDTPSGHWEIAGVPVLFDWGYFPEAEPCFPDELIKQLIKRAKLPGILGNKHASGTKIIESDGQAHIETGKPIVYTSADSVFQIACHEQSFGLQNLYDLCEIARELVDTYNIGRVIARPFIGEPGHFSRTGNRKDYATPPPAPTLFDKLITNHGQVIAIGKTADIFAHRGISQEIKATGNMALFDATLNALKTAPDNSLIFTNFVDFDSHYGHRRDVAGYAYALECFDKRLPELESQLTPGDMVVITADHGCDPTWIGSDHTREHIPVLAYGPGLPTGSIGERECFADIGQSIATHLNMRPLDYGSSFLR